MGWASAVYIFNGVADSLVKEVKDKYVSEAAATRVLAALFKDLRDGDWDTVDEALQDYSDVPWVLDAIEAGGYDKEEVDFFRNLDQYANDDIGMYRDEY